MAQTLGWGRRLLLAGACALAGRAAAGEARLSSLSLYTEEYPPFSWADPVSGKARGMAVDLVSTLARRAGVDARAPAVMPWARALAQALAEPGACVFSAARSPERETRFQWIGPIGRNEMVIYARRADKIRLRSLDDARPYRIGTYLGDASSNYFVSGGFRIEPAASNRLNPQKLHMGRIDLWPVGRLSGLAMLREQGLTDLEPVLSFDRADMYLACNRAMPAPQAALLNSTLRTMYQDGTVRAIYASYGFDADAPRLDPPRR